LMRAMLAKAKTPATDVELVCVGSLAAGLHQLATAAFDVALLDLSLPDADGLEALYGVRAEWPSVPIVVLTGLNDERAALAAVQAGAQDYLLKDQITDGHTLLRAVRYAIERQRLQCELQSLSLVDDLTGLYNRRGFLTLAEQQFKTAQRNATSFMLMYADMDGLKQINDTYGHEEGSRALARMGEILRATFRASDIIARLGGDEFTVLATDIAPAHVETVTARLQANIAADNARSETLYNLSLSYGTVCFDPRNSAALEALMVCADRAMYEHKRARKGLSNVIPPPEGDAGAGLRRG